MNKEPTISNEYISSKIVKIKSCKTDEELEDLIKAIWGTGYTQGYNHCFDKAYPDVGF